MSRWPTPPLDVMIPKIVEVKMTNPIMEDLMTIDRAAMSAVSRASGRPRVIHRGNHLPLLARRVHRGLTRRGSSVWRLMRSITVPMWTGSVMIEMRITLFEETLLTMHIHPHVLQLPLIVDREPCFIAVLRPQRSTRQALMGLPRRGISRRYR